jgi:hypothetical protein
VTRTSDLIEALAESAAPVRRLRPPIVRAAQWLLLAAIVILLLSVAHGLRPDIELRLYQPIFVVSMVSAAITGVLAAIAAFELSRPEASRWWFALPTPFLMIWLSTISYGCLTDWVSMGPNGIRMGEAARCFATLLLTSVPLSIAMLVMLRYAALLRPTAVCTAGGLAVAAITSFALSLFHSLDATIMILVWNLGTAVLIAGLASVFGRPMLTWFASRLMPAAFRSLGRP